MTPMTPSRRAGRPAWRAAWPWLLALAIVACTPVTSPTPAATGTGAPSAPATASPTGVTATPAGSLDRAAAWQADLALIVPGIERIHPDPFRGTPKADLEAAVADLSARATTLTDDQLMVGVLKVAAMVSANACDGHTGGFIWGTGTYPLDSLPLRLWLFGEELVVVDELGSLGLVGARIDAIEGRPIDDVLATLDPVIPRDNEQTVRLLTPRYLLIPQVLRGLGLADDGPITVAVSRDGIPSEIEIEPIPMADYNAWAGPYGLHLPGDPDVRYLARIDDALWWERLRKGPLYIQYNRVEFMPTEMADLREAATAPDVNRVILDIRHNFGGEVPALDAMVAIFEDPAVDVPGELFLITGRNTWSAGVMLTARLEAQTSVVIIGEPTAGCPTFYGDVVELALPNSGIVLLVTEMLEVGVDPADTRSNIPLDAEAELTLEEWLDGIDPALELLEVDAA